MNLLITVVLVLFLLVVLYMCYSYYAYNRVKPANRECTSQIFQIELDGYHLFYREIGKQKDMPPIVLIHGGPGHSSLSFKNGFDFLSERSRVIFYDQRGSGNSQVKPIPSDYTIEKLVEELENLRKEKIGTEQIILIAHSFGSVLAQRYALKYEQHVAKLILVSGLSINSNMNNRFIWKWFGPTLYSLGLGFPPEDSSAADKWFSENMDSDVRRLFDPKRADLIKDVGTTSFAPWHEISLSLVGSDYKEQLRLLKIPTIFIYGVADSKFTGKPVADYLSLVLPNFQSTGFEQSGHWPFLEEPEKFQQTLSSFLEK